MQLRDAIIKCIDEFGPDIVAEPKFINILDDTGAFKESPVATKKIMRQLIANGFGASVVEISKNKPKGWHNQIKKEINDFITFSGYSEKLVEKIANDILFATGILTDLKLKNEKSQLLFGILGGIIVYKEKKSKQLSKSKSESKNKTKSTKPKVKKNSNSTQPSPTPPSNLKLIKDKEDHYIIFLKRCYRITVDEFNLKNATFRTEKKQELKDLENELSLLWTQNHIRRVDWFKTQKKDFISKNSSSFSDRMKVLDNLKTQYTSRLQTLVNYASGKKPDLNDRILTSIRNKIITVGKDIPAFSGINWCNAQDASFMKIKVQSTDRRYMYYLIVFIILIFLFLFIFSFYFN